jgi:hypothetical protein
MTLNLDKKVLFICTKSFNKKKKESYWNKMRVPILAQKTWTKNMTSNNKKTERAPLKNREKNCCHKVQKEGKVSTSFSCQRRPYLNKKYKKIVLCQ